MRKIILFLCVCCLVGVAYAQEPFRVMFYNVENLFDCQHDTLKNLMLPKDGLGQDTMINWQR